MALRWASAAVGIPLFLGCCLWGRGPFAVGVLCLAIIGLTEMLRTYGRQEPGVNAVAALPGLLAPLSVWVSMPVLIAVAALLLLAACAGEVVRAARAGDLHAGRRLATGLLCGAYVALFGGMAALRSAGTPIGAGAWPHLEAGAARLLLTAFCVWATDTLALFAGRAFGRRKLAPALSPGKTVEGSIGGLAGALLVGALFGQLFFAAPVPGLAVGAIAGVFGQVGDLFESALKREAGVKDFGALMPGHGGVLDRFDSLLFVAPLSALLFGVLH